MKKISALLLSVFILNFLNAQDIITINRNTLKDIIKSAQVKHYQVPLVYFSSYAPILPSEVDNSTLKYFRNIIHQDGWSCNQAGGIAYTFTYEINRLRDLSSDSSINQYPTHFTFNFLNDAIPDQGVSFFDTWDILKTLGTPNSEEYGGLAPGKYIYWPSGYELYYHAMHNRIIDYYRITVKDETGLNNLKYWLFDHLEGSTAGGLANFMIGSTGIVTDSLPTGTPEAGKQIITSFGPYVGHNMTIVGYNDSIRYDFNKDGRYTNDTDLNNDGIINLNDWEIGAFKAANSWGYNFADSGFVYVMYRLAAEDVENGGIMNNDFFVVKAKENVEPLLSLKVGMEHSSREKIKITPGISSNYQHSLPEYHMELPLFNFHGGNFPMKGDTGQNPNFIEFGLDISPLLSYIESNQNAAIYLIIEENDPQNLADGTIKYVSAIDHSNNNEEYLFPATEIPVNNNGVTVLSMPIQLAFNKPQIVSSVIPPFIAGEPYSFQLQAVGGTPPYQWYRNLSYSMELTETEFELIDDEMLSMSNNFNGYAEKILEFQFPFFDKTYHKVYVFTDGYIKFETDELFWPYIIDPFQLFKLETTVSPMATDLTLIPHQNKCVWYTGNEEFAVFRWSAVIPEQENESEVNFAVKLYKSGKIEFLYGKMSATNTITYLSGVSNGNLNDYMCPDLPDFNAINQNTCVSFVPKNIPQGIDISESGLISGTIQEDDIDFIIDAGVRDNNNLFNEKSQRLPSEKLLVRHNLISGTDTLIEPGENAAINVKVTNTSPSVIHGVQVTMSSENPFFSFTDFFEFFGDINPGETVVINSACEFDISPYAKNNTPVIINAKYISNEFVYEYTHFESIAAPDIFLNQYTIEDGNNNLLEPGEPAGLIVSLANCGKTNATGITARLTCQDESVIIEEETVYFGTIPQFSFVENNYAILVNTYTPIGYQPGMMIEILDSGGNVIQTVPFKLQVGKIPLLVVDLDKQLHSSPLFDSILSGLHVEYEVDYEFPANLANYHSIFLCLGGYFNNYELSEWEGEQLAVFLNNGGYLYMEGRPTWKDDQATAVHSLFNTQVVDTSWFLIDSVFGASGSIYEGLTFDFHAQNRYCNFNFIPDSGSEVFLYNMDFNNPCVIGNNAGNYKTIASSVTFGELEYCDNIIHSDSLLMNYLQFFNIGQSTLHIESPSSPSVQSMLVYPNPSNDVFHIIATDAHLSGVSLGIYSTDGALIENITPIDTREQSIHFCWNPEKTSSGSIRPGVYFCKLQSGNCIYTNKLLYLK